MNSIAVSSIVFLSILASGLVGMAVRRAMPADRLGSGEKEVARLVTGLMTTMTAIVLGMLVSSAKASYDARTNEIAEISSQVVTIDRMLSKYGTETAEMRAQFRLLVEASVNRIWPAQAPEHVELKPRDEGEILVDELQLLAPKSGAQAEVKAQILRMIVELRQMQWLLFLKSQQSALPIPLLLVVVTWLSLIYLSFGLFTQPSSTIIVTLAFGALAVSTAVLIILELYTPFRGVLRISSNPILEALSEMGR
jgi:Protein of unknown function (DUF4239)